MLAWKNCTDWKQNHDDNVAGYETWEDKDERRCDILEDFMYSGPNLDQIGDNQEAADEITNTDWQNKQSLCELTYV